MGEENEEVYTDASLSNPEVSNFLMDPKKLQGDLEIWERNEREKEGVVGEVKGGIAEEEEAAVVEEKGASEEEIEWKRKYDGKAGNEEHTPSHQGGSLLGGMVKESENVQNEVQKGEKSEAGIEVERDSEKTFKGGSSASILEEVAQKSVGNVLAKTSAVVKEVKSKKKLEKVSSGKIKVEESGDRKGSIKEKVIKISKQTTDAMESSAMVGGKRERVVESGSKKTGEGGMVNKGENRNLKTPSRGSKTEAAASMLKQVQGENKTHHSKASDSTMMAPKVPGDISVKQLTPKSKTTKKAMTPGSGNQLTARMQSEAAKKYMEEQTRASLEEKANTRVGKSLAEKRSQLQNIDNGNAGTTQGPPFKRPRRSDEARASPRKLEHVSPQAASVPTSRSRIISGEVVQLSSEVLRERGRPVNPKKTKMTPLGPWSCVGRLRFFEKAAIKAGRGVGVDGGFIEDVKEGVRLVVERSAKDISYQALRLMKLTRSILFTILPT